MSTKDYSKIIVNDERTPEEKGIYTHLIIGIDDFMSHWGEAAGGLSLAAWACTPDLAHRVKAHVCSRRTDMRNVAELIEPLTLADLCKGTYTTSKVAHISIYKVDENHAYAQPFRSR